MSDSIHFSTEDILSLCETSCPPADVPVRDALAAQLVGREIRLMFPGCPIRRPCTGVDPAARTVSFENVLGVVETVPLSYVDMPTSLESFREQIRRPEGGRSSILRVSGSTKRRGRVGSPIDGTYCN